MKAIIRQLNKRFFEVMQEFCYVVLEYKITVPKDFETDLASTPKFLWLTFPPFGKYTDAAIIHDYLYSKNCVYNAIDRATADLIFLELMKQLEVPFWKRQAMYRAVRLFGSRYFRKGA